MSQLDLFTAPAPVSGVNEELAPSPGFEAPLRLIRSDVIACNMCPGRVDMSQCYELLTEFNLTANPKRICLFEATEGDFTNA